MLILDETYKLPSADRRRFGRTLWFFGDSIFRGFALGTFADQIAPERIDRDPLWPFRSPAAMINLFLYDLGLLKLNSAGVATEGEYVAVFAGTTGFPEIPRKGRNHVRRAAKTGLIRAGDTLAFLDAAQHAGDPGSHEAAWKDIRRAAAATGVPILMCTAFDNLAHDRRTSVGGGKKELCMHDLPWAGGRSHNDALRAAAADRTIPGEVRLVEASSIIKKWHAELQSRYQIPA
ncbi:MAG: hypothetical protein H7X97_02435, partial [Opitutaceae bacterium]|nr:hypothetical protein [Verrucomicrobiales bacterium]